MQRGWMVRLPALALFSLSLACYGSVDEAGDSGEDGTGDTGETGGDGDGDGDGGEAEELPTPSPRHYRLTHTQWGNTVGDLFNLPDTSALIDLLRDDPQVAGFIFDNGATALEVDEALWTGYRLAAAAVAEQVTSDPNLLADWVPAEGPPEAERIVSFVREFGERAYRRPLSDAELETLVVLFGAAPALYPDVDDSFTAGIRHVIEAVLQSPFFLYRIERSEVVVDDMIPLDSYEIASRLSYFLWNTMPDEALFGAAADGALSTAAEVAVEAERMLDDPRAAQMVVRFHEQLLDADKFETISPSNNFFPNAPDDLGALAAAEHEAFIRDVVFGGGGGLAELLTSSETFVNDDLAAIYGVPGVVGDTMVHTDLDPTQRKGVFTQVGFLAANATSVDPDPIHRGVFIAKRMLCISIAAPPDDIPALPPVEPDQTNRERVAQHTSAQQCAQCHAGLINPHGFVFEGYDAIGGWRITDNGQPVDTTADVFVDQVTPVGDALGMLDLMAESPSVHSCYARHWLEYTNGRNAVPEDNPTIARIGSDSLEGQQSLREMLVSVTTSPVFRNRAAEEQP